MFKIAAELLPTMFHVPARSIATQALSIFGDHREMMAVRGAGWGMHEVSLAGAKGNGTGPLRPPVTINSPQFVRSVLGQLAGGHGDELPVSALPVGGARTVPC